MKLEADAQSVDLGRPFMVGDARVDPASNRVFRGGEEIRLEPRCMQVLVEIARRRGAVVSRETLESEVWRSMVVGPDSLTNAIIKLRRALGDDARAARVIETIPKTGYRLLAPLRAADDEPPAPLERKLCAILYADVAGYSRLTGEDEDRTHRALSARLDRLAALVGEHKGVVVHYAGDAVLAEFPTASDALSCAVAAQREFAAAAVAEPDAAVAFRIGVNLGEVIVDRGDIYGDGVNVAARLEGLADTGGICVSESVRTAVGNKLPLEFEFMGEQQVKNIAGGVRAWRVHFYPASRPARRSSRRTVAAAIAVLLATALAAAFLVVRRGDDGAPVPLAGGKPVIAVVPFANVSVEAADEYVADGLTDDVITDLSRVSGLDVIARGTVFTYKNRPINVVEIGRELGAHYVLEGSVRRAGEAVRINVQLVDAVSGRHLWAERYERPWRDFFALQEEVIARIVEAVSVRLTDTEAERIARVPTSSLEAYDYYLRAEQAGYIGGAEGLGTTMALYARAIELDPEFADAHAGLARAAVEAWREDVSHLISGARARDSAYRSASRAIELDPANGRAWAVLAVLQLAEGHHDAAIESARRAVAVAPGSAQAHLDLALVLAMSGQPADASAAVDTALRLDPRPSPDAMLYAGVVRFHDGRYQEAVDALATVRDSRASSSLLWMYLAAAQGRLGQVGPAREALERFLEIFPAASLEYYEAAYAYIRDPGDLDELVRGLEAAGLPRWPYGVDPPASALLDERSLAELAIGRTWTGRHLNGVDFVQEIDAAGRLAYRSEASLQSGTANIRDGRLCQRFDYTTLNRELCGLVYRNADGSFDGRDEYLVVMPDTVRYFSAVPR